MKKSRFLALTLVVAIMLMGAGYAYWTDTLKMDTYVSTGYLDVDFQNALVVPTDGADAYLTQSAIIGALNTPPGEEPEDKDLLTITLENLYPGAWGQYSFEIVNTGTIPVVLQGLRFQQADGWLDIEAAVGLELTGPGCDVAIDFDMLGLNSNDVIIDFSGGTAYPSGGGTIDGAVHNDFDDLCTLVLEPGQSINGTLDIFMMPGIGNSSNLEDKSIQYTLTYDFIQANQNTDLPAQ